MIYQISKLALNLILVLLSPIFLLFLLPIYGFRFVVSRLVVLCDSSIDKILTTRSSCSGAEPIYKGPKCSLIVVNIFEGTLSVDEYRHVYQTRVIDSKDVNGKFRKPEFQQFVTKRCGFLFWKWEENFDIKKHIRAYDGKFKDQFLNGSKPVNLETITEVTDELVYQPFKRLKSPWEALLIHNYRESDPVSGEPVGPASTVMILRIHHCLGDGFSIMKTFNYDITQAKEFDSAVPKYVSPKRRSPVLRALEFLFSAPYEFLSEATNAVDVNSWHVPRDQLKIKLNSAISHPIPMEYVKEVKNLNKASFTALIIECFTAALRKFMNEAGYSIPDTIHCVTPLPVPGHPDKMRNHMYVGIYKPTVL